MNTEQIQQLKAEIKLALAAFLDRAETIEQGSKAIFIELMAIHWDDLQLRSRITGITSGWLLCKGLVPNDPEFNLNKLITETKNEFLQEYHQ